jgi:hypothetical protein
VSAKTLGNKIYSVELLELIDDCLQLDFMSRPQSVFSLQKKIAELSPVEFASKPSFVNKIKNVLNKKL